MATPIKPTSAVNVQPPPNGPSPKSLDAVSPKKALQGSGVGRMLSFSVKSCIKWVLILVVVAMAWYLWGRITAVQGSQKVAFVPATQTCGSIERLRYCVYRARAGVNGDIIYHLHGRNLDERIWNDDTYWTSMVQSEWQRSGVNPPIVVTISYGPTWLLAPKGKAADSGLLEDFMSKLPAIEAKIGRPRRRLLLGESMGGFNVLVAGLTYPAQFAKIASLCPGVYTTSPFDSFSKMKSALVRTGADPKIGFGVWLMSKKIVADESEWKRVSPLELIKRADQQYPSMYLSNGLYDSYGNFEGTQQLALDAARRGVQTQWHPLYGGHCAIDVPSLARFLAS
jgi:pimeloyl-ACP methyl ester carboxylesterase